MALCYFGAVLFAGIGVAALVMSEAPAGFLFMLFSWGFALGMYYLGRGVARFHPVAFWLALVSAVVQIFQGAHDLKTIDPAGRHVVFRMISIGLGVVYVIYFVHRRRDFFRRSEA